VLTRSPVANDRLSWRHRWQAVLTLTAALVVLTAGVVSIGLAIVSSPTTGATTRPSLFTLTVSPGQNLTTGQSLHLTVTRTTAGTAAGVEIRVVDTGWCESGTLPYTIPARTKSGYLYTFGFPIKTSHVVCTTHFHPLNGDELPVTVISPDVKPTANYTSVSGIVIAQTSTATPVAYGTVVCNPTHPCTLAAAVYTIDPTHPTTAGIYFIHTQVTFQPTSVSVACGGVAPGEFQSSSPDRLGRLVTDWTLDGCHAKLAGGGAVSTDISAGKSDEQALCAFAAGKSDLAYSAIGYGTSSSPFNPSHCTTRAADILGPQPDRAYVAVPIALNAVVLTHSQTLKVANVAGTTFVFSDYPQLDIKDNQMGQVLGTAGGQPWTTTLGQQLVAQNPTLADDFSYNTINTGKITHDSNGVNGVITTSGTQATTLFATSFLATLVPTTLISPTTHHKTGVTANFASAEPSYNVQTETGLTAGLVRYLTPGQQPFSLLSASDAAAIWGGQADFALQTYDSRGSSTPSYVAATTASMQAAVADMTPQADGTLLPNPKATAVNGTEPYPLTYVEYAMAPAQPLETANCAARPQAEQDLLSWLDYVTGAGQAELPAGYTPLTQSLLTQAQAAIAKVGQTASTCTAGNTPAGGSSTTSATTTGKSATGSLTGTGASTTTSSTTPSGTTGTGSSASGSSNGTGSSGATGSRGSTSTSSSRRSTTSGSGTSAKSGTSVGGSTKGGNGAKVEPLDSDVDLSGFKGGSGTSWLVPALGVLLLFLLLPGLVLMAAGRSPRQSLAKLGRWLRWGRHGPPGGSP
jgi:hypothetical protein